MTINDKIVLAVGIATCITMCVAGWIGERAFNAITSPKDPTATPETDEERNTRRNKPWAALCLLSEGLVILILSWFRHRYDPTSYVSIVEIALGFATLSVAFTAYLVRRLLDFGKDYMFLFRSQSDISKRIHDEVSDHWEMMKLMAGEIDKKANSRKKISN